MIFVFTCGMVLPPGVGYAQSAPQPVLNLPAPGTMVTPTQAFMPTAIKGISLYPDNPLMFDFIVDQGDEHLSSQELKTVSRKLIKYFLASLTVPARDLWVNLSPYEKNRIMPEGFGDTEMGRDMLAMDYLLKQLTSSLMYPESELGRAFWSRVYDEAYRRYGTTEIPVNTFNKIWIVPESAAVYEHDNSVFVVNSRLKVLLEEDYLALEKNMGSTRFGLDQMDRDDAKAVSEISSQVVKDVLIPAIEQEVNEGKTFAQLRQIYHSMILAAWYKQNLRDSLLGYVYVDKNKTAGVDTRDKQVNQKIYDQYIQAFRKGVYNYIKEDYDATSRKVIPRKYFSGGTNFRSLFRRGAIKKVSSSSIGDGQGFLSRSIKITALSVEQTEKNGAAIKDLEARIASSSIGQDIHETIHKPWLQKRLESIKDELTPLLDLYFLIKDRPEDVQQFLAEKEQQDLKQLWETAFKGKTNKEVLTALEDRIGELVDRVNVLKWLEEEVRKGTVQQAKVITVEDFKKQDNGKLYAEYLQKAQETILSGDYVPQFLFAGKATRLNRGAMYGVDIWEIAQEVGLSVPKDALHLGMGPRQLLAYVLLVKSLARKAGLDAEEVLRHQKVMIHLNDEVEHVAFEDFLSKNFYGLNPANVYFSTIPEFKGYKLNEDGRLVQDEASRPLTYGHGHTIVHLDTRGEVYQIDAQGHKIYLKEDFLTAMGSRFIGSHRVNDLTKFDVNEVVDMDKLALGLYLQDKGHAIVADLVANPNKQKGGTALNVGLLETLAAKGSPVLMNLLNQMGEQGAPYNAFRLLYRADRLKKLLDENQLSYYLRFKDGYFYLETVTGDLTLFPDSRTAFIQRQGDVIHDFKKVGNAPEAVPYLMRSDAQIREGIKRGDLPFLKLEDGSGGKTSASPITPKPEKTRLQVKKPEKVGGIDLDPTILDLQIKRDGKGVPLPIWDQPIEQMHIEGFVPVIINIQSIPASQVPLLLGLQGDEECSPGQSTPCASPRLSAVLFSKIGTATIF